MSSPPRSASAGRSAPSSSCREATPASFPRCRKSSPRPANSTTCGPRSIAACANIPRPARCFTGFAKTATDWPELINPELLSAILSACERDQHNESNSRSTRLRDLLLSDRSLIPDIFAGAELGLARDAMRRLMLSPVFDELTKRSLMARIIKLYPDLQSLVSGEQPEEKSEALVVSWSSLQKRKGRAGGVGEQKNSREQQGDRRRPFLRRLAGEFRIQSRQGNAGRPHAPQIRARTRPRTAPAAPTFESPDLSQVSIGTIVTLRETNTNAEETYTILGAWDGDPDRAIISYQTAIGKSLLGHRSARSWN